MTRLRLFDGFPYIITRIVSALYHVILLPDGQPEEVLVDLAQAQLDANRLQLALVLGKRRAVYFSVDGSRSVSCEPPRGGAVIRGRLAPPVDFLQTDDVRDREERLAALVAETSPGGYMLGDLTKGGHAATDAERTHLAGCNEDGSPRGLLRCPTCHDWRGVCLDPSEAFSGRVMAVHCLCENHNRCARCGWPLNERRLNANYYDPADGQIWHVPGFCGLAHACHTGLRRDAPDPVTQSEVSAEASRRRI